MNKIPWYAWLIIIIIATLFTWSIIISNKYSSLKNEYYLLKNTNQLVIDSLNRENQNIAKAIDKLKLELNSIEKEIIIVEDKKEEVKDKNFTVSNNLSESVKILKDNLLCVGL